MNRYVIIRREIERRQEELKFSGGLPLAARMLRASRHDELRLLLDWIERQVG